MSKLFAVLALLVIVACVYAVPSSANELLARHKRLSPKTCLAAGMWDTEQQLERIMEKCWEKHGNSLLSKGCVIGHYMHLGPKELANFIGCVFAD